MKRKLQIQDFFFHVVVNWHKQKKKTQDLWNVRLDFHHCWWILIVETTKFWGINEVQ